MNGSMGYSALSVLYEFGSVSLAQVGLIVKQMKKTDMQKITHTTIYIEGNRTC